VNTNINYNSAAEAAAELYAMRAIAAYLGRELSKLQERGAQRAGGGVIWTEALWQES